MYDLWKSFSEKKYLVSGKYLTSWGAGLGSRDNDSGVIKPLQKDI